MMMIVCAASNVCLCGFSLDTVAVICYVCCSSMIEDLIETRE